MVKPVVAGPLDRVADRHGEQRRAVLAGRRRRRPSTSSSVRQGRAASWIATNSQAGRTPLECPGDGVGPLGPALDDVEVQERDLVAVAAVEQLAILGRDRHDDLLDFAVREERVEGAEPDGAALELGVDLLLLAGRRTAWIARRRGGSRRTVPWLGLLNHRPCTMNALIVVPPECGVNARAEQESTSEPDSAGDVRPLARGCDLDLSVP